jgi:hypothetical protein
VYFLGERALILYEYPSILGCVNFLSKPNVGSWPGLRLPLV